MLASIGRKGGPPTPPLNLVGDYAGGAMLAAFGILAALQERTRSGRGQVVDAAMVDGVATLFAEFFGFTAAGLHGSVRGGNLLDSGAPHYEVYECADGEWLSVAPIEDKFRAILLERLGIDSNTFPDVRDPAHWEAGKRLLADIFRTRPRDAWCALFAGTDACVAPVLSMAEAPAHPHAQARDAYLNHHGLVQPAPSPRFSRTPGAVDLADERARTIDTLRAWPLSDAQREPACHASARPDLSRPAQALCAACHAASSSTFAPAARSASAVNSGGCVTGRRPTARRSSQSGTGLPSIAHHARRRRSCGAPDN